MAEGSALKIVAAMPAYNEAAHVSDLVRKAKQHVDEVIVFDDGSTDNTGEVARAAGATVFRHERNEGKGVAIQRIIAEARRRSPDVLVLLDADAQHNPDEIPRLVKAVMEGADLVIGSRILQAGKTPRYRRIGQKILLSFARVISGRNLTDSESGFRALSRKALATLNLKEKGFAVETEMIAQAADGGLRIAEVPISNIYTADGSTLNPIKHGLGLLTRIIVMISERRPLLFFGFGGGILVLLGLLAGVMALWSLFTIKVLPFGMALLSASLLIIGILSIFTGIILNVVARGRRE